MLQKPGEDTGGGTTDPAISGHPDMKIECSLLSIALPSDLKEIPKGHVTTCDCLIRQPSKWQKLSTQIARDHLIGRYKSNFHCNSE